MAKGLGSEINHRMENRTPTFKIRDFWIETIGRRLLKHLFFHGPGSPCSGG